MSEVNGFDIVAAYAAAIAKLVGDKTPDFTAYDVTSLVRKVAPQGVIVNHQENKHLVEDAYHSRQMPGYSQDLRSDPAKYGYGTGGHPNLVFVYYRLPEPPAPAAVAAEPVADPAAVEPPALTPASDPDPATQAVQDMAASLWPEAAVQAEEPAAA